MKARLLCLMLIVPLYGAMADTADMRHAVRSTRGDVVTNSFHHCIRSSWEGATDECGTAIALQEPARISQEERTVYFDFNRYALTPEAVQKLGSLATKLISDKQVSNARIVGYADRIGTASYNEKLSQKRADNVRRYLVSSGFVKNSVTQTRWLGESVPVTQCPDTLGRLELIECLRKDRRVEVEIDYLPVK